MKKYVSIILAALLVLSTLLLTACGGGSSDTEDLKNSRYVGTWTAKGIAIGDDSENLDDEFLMVLNEDGTGTLSGSTEGEDEVSEFTWKLVDGGFKCSGDVKTTFKDDGDNIKTKIIGVDLVFEKQQ